MGSPGTGGGIGTWTSPAWRAGALAWLDERLAEAGIARTGPAEHPHVRPWATAIVVPTDAGRVWLKAASPAMAVEIRIYPLLAAAAPATVLQPIAIDTERGLIVLSDGGPVLGETLEGPALHRAMAGAMADYAILQRRLADQVPALLEAGVDDMRPAILPRRFGEALRAAAGVAGRAGSARATRTLAGLPALAADVERWSRELAGAPGAPSIDHNDLHSWNVFAGNPPRIFDWGDSVVAHPFASMLVPLTFLRDHAGAGARDLVLVRDAYLDAFADLGSRADLVATLEVACRVAKVARSLVWARALAAAEDEETDHMLAPLETLAAMRGDDHLGGA